MGSAVVCATDPAAEAAGWDGDEPRERGFNRTGCWWRFSSRNHGALTFRLIARIPRG